MNDLLAVTTRLLRDPNGLIDDHDRPVELARIAPLLLGLTVGGGALFGLMVGSQKGDIQLLYGAVKMPLLLLAPPLLSLPAVHALYKASGVGVSWPRLSLAALAGMARSAILAAALGPVLWLLYSVDIDYHLAVLLLAGSLGLAGLPGVLSLLRALPRGGDMRILAGVGSALLLFFAFAQTGWLLRPFVARPNAEVSFLRPIEEDVFSGLGATSRSAGGDYGGWDVESRGLLAPPAAPAGDPASDDGQPR